MPAFTLAIESVAFWSPTLPDWPTARAVFRGEGFVSGEGQRIPAPSGLPPGERRRAPESVALALHVAEAAMAGARCSPQDVLSVFTSAHGDLPVIDHLCSTLVHDPRMVSPTRFVHSIHNAPAGVWSMLHQNRHAHAAISAGEYSYACGLLEAAMTAQTEQRPVLLVAYDTAAVGALTHTTHSAAPMALAMVLQPGSPAADQASLRWRLDPPEAEKSGSLSPQAQALPPNGMSPALPWLACLARESATKLELPLSPHQCLSLEYQPPHKSC